MAIEKTLSIVKPDAVARNLIGAVIQAFEQAGLKVVALRQLRLSQDQARAFYQVHRERPFYDSLTRYMSSGPIVPMILEGEDAIRKVREIMGATDPAKAAAGTLRKLYAENVERNVVHGSDAVATAAIETAFFFSGLDSVSMPG